MKKIEDLSEAQQRVARTLYRAVELDGGGYFLPFDNGRKFCGAGSVTLMRVCQAAYEGLEIEEGKTLYVTRTEDLSALPSTRIQARFVDLHMLPGLMLTAYPVRRVYVHSTGEYDWCKA